MKLGLNDALITALGQVQRQYAQPSARGDAPHAGQGDKAALIHGRAQYQAPQTDRLAELQPKEQPPVPSVKPSSAEAQSGASQLRFERDIPRGSYLDITV